MVLHEVRSPILKSLQHRPETLAQNVFCLLWFCFTFVTLRIDLMLSFHEATYYLYALRAGVEVTMSCSIHLVV